MINFFVILMWLKLISTTSETLTKRLFTTQFQIYVGKLKYFWPTLKICRLPHFLSDPCSFFSIDSFSFFRILSSFGLDFSRRAEGNKSFVQEGIFKEKSVTLVWKREKFFKSLNRKILSQLLAFCNLWKILFSSFMQERLCKIKPGNFWTPFDLCEVWRFRR